jgi:probable O-glycosylation ligase (exosortase A-associated)
MKQTIIMILLTLAGTAGVFVLEPIWGVWVYYLFAVLRPQYMWDWALPLEVNWSRFVALATLTGLVAMKLGLLSPPKAQQDAQEPTPGLSVAHYGMAAFASWIFLCYFVCPKYDPVQTEFVFVEYVKIFIMYFTATALIRRLQHVWVLFVMTGICLAYISYEMNYLYLISGYLAIYRRGYAGLDNNGAALMLAMGVPVCLFLWEGIRRWYRWAFLAFIPVIIHAVLMSYSRGAMVSLLVASPLWLIRSRRRVFLGVTYGALFAMLPFLAGKEIRARFFSIEQHEIDDSARQRRQSWAAAISIANTYPIFGVGLRCANLVSQEHGADEAGRTIHSQYLQIAADTGWVGCVLFLVMLGSSVLNLRRVRHLLAGREDEDSVRARAIASGTEGALLVFCVGALFLSVEVFELPFLMMLMMAQLSRVSGVVSPAAVPQIAAPEVLYPEPFVPRARLGGWSG